MPTVALIVLLSVLFAAVPATAGDIIEVAIEATVETLDNGLKVILVEDHSVPVISYQTFFRVGARNERAGITGISHFMEHMMFNGADKYGPKEFDAVLEANGGYSNAFTSNDMTAYYEDISSDGLELCVDLDSDRIKSLTLDPKFIASEMNVVKEERRLRIDNSVRGQMREDLDAIAFKAHPYKWPVIGWMSDLDAIDRDDCVEYFKTYYAPNNAILIVAGDFDTKKAMKLIHQYYDDIPAQEPPKPVRTVEPEQMGERRGVVRKRAELPAVMIAYHTPDIKSEDIYTLDVLQQILTGGKSSRLHRRLVRETEAAMSVRASFPWRIDPYLFEFNIKMKPGHETLEAEEAVYAELIDIIENGVREEELARAKNVLEADFVRSMQTVNGRATKIGRYEILFGDYREIMNVPGRYRAVTDEQVRAAAQKYFASRNRTVVTLVPEA
ncbi:MAG: insulinase family protein [Candidatus Krumholzibacteria bacterium]|nr:insulinase family protein [Candidatus Krumholzibacteria bacterium]